MTIVPTTIPAVEQFIRDFVENSGFDITDDEALNLAARDVVFRAKGQYLCSDYDIDIEALDNEYGFIA